MNPVPLRPEDLGKSVQATAHKVHPDDKQQLVKGTLVKLTCYPSAIDGKPIILTEFTLRVGQTNIDLLIPGDIASVLVGGEER